MCEHYTPLSDDYSDKYYEYLVESKRDDFRQEFIEYISEYNDDLFY